MTLVGASAVSHNLFARVLGITDERRELRMSRFATAGIGVAAILLGLAFRTQNVVYMVGVALAIAASANFPILVGPAIWVKTLGYATPMFPYDPPALLTVPLAFIVAWAVSLMTQPNPAAQALGGATIA